jgi:hypothetical protein
MSFATLYAKDLRFSVRSYLIQWQCCATGNWFSANFLTAAIQFQAEAAAIDPPEYS